MDRDLANQFFSGTFIYLSFLYIYASLSVVVVVEREKGYASYATHHNVTFIKWSRKKQMLLLNCTYLIVAAHTNARETNLFHYTHTFHCVRIYI